MSRASRNLGGPRTYESYGSCDTGAIMKIEGYRCRICKNQEFLGKGGTWVCSQCFTPVPVSLLTYMEFEDHRPMIRIGSTQTRMQTHQ